MRAMSVRFMRKKEVIEVTGLSNSTIWRLEKDGFFPKRKKISNHAIGWLAHEVYQWINEKANAT